MSNHILKFDFINQLVYQILQFKETCILIGLEVSEPQLMNHIFPQFFPHIFFLRKVGGSLILSYSSKKNFCRVVFVFPTNFFFQKSSFVTFHTLRLSNIMQKKSVEHWWTNYEIFRSKRRDERTNKSKFTGGLL